MQGSTDVPYPEGAHGDAAVQLELVVEKDGTVSRVDVIDGSEPFAEQARRAASSWRFEPARRGDTPIAARVRARVEFKKEPDEAPPAPEVSKPPTRAPVAPEPAENVTVRGVRRETGQTTLTAAEVREAPGAFGDPFRAIDALPSVTPVVGGVPYFYIRGAPPSDNGYYLDGIRVPLLFHVGFGPGVIHPGLLERVDLFPSSPPARYGRSAGAVVAGQLRDPAATLRGEANLRLFDAGALVELPFAGGRGTALVAGRYGYPGPILGAISEIKLGYWDYQSRATWQFGERDGVSVLAFGSHDYLAHRDQKGRTVEDIVSDFHRLDVRYDHAFADGHLRVALTGGLDSQGAAPSYLTDKTARFRIEFEHGLSDDLRLRAGADVQRDDYGVVRTTPLDPEQPLVPSSVDPSPINVAGGAYADAVIRMAPRVEVVPGARVDVFHSSRGGAKTTVPAFDPRLSARVGLARNIAWLSTFGLSHQYPVLRVGSVPALVITGSGFPPGTNRLQSAAQASQGIEVMLPAEVVLSATGFLAGFTGLTDLTADCIQAQSGFVPLAPTGVPPMRPYRCPDDEPVSGRAYGVELSVRRPLTKRLAGLLSYTLSRSTRESHFLTPEGGQAVATVPSEVDRTHVLNAIAAYDLGGRWRAGLRFVFYSGAPYSSLDGNIPVPPYNDRRLPPFFRLDLRVEKRWKIGDNGSIAFVVEGQNVTLSKEAAPVGLDCEGVSVPGQDETLKCRKPNVGPLTIPSIGVEAFF